uniref:ADP-ribosylation factor-like protein 6 n=1 Tax=Globodera rostochiensis TaxID=31243 RepID=A0A914H246_GLORO
MSCGGCTTHGLTVYWGAFKMQLHYLGNRALYFFPSTLSSFFSTSGRQVEILILGLDNSGKTTFLNQLKPPETQTSNIVPTVGYTTERFSAAGMMFTAYDMSGESRYRNLWETQYKNVNGIIFVVDSTDKLRIAVARDELWMLLDHKDLTYKKTPLLILANKSDLKDAVPASEIHLNLGLDLIRNRNWHIVSTCALTGSGLVEGIDWLANNIKQLLTPTI